MQNLRKSLTVSNINSLRLASPLEVDSVSNGDGLRMVLWFQGCLYECKGCHNLESWAIDGGQVYLIEDIVNEIKKHPHNEGLTLSGGDPLLQISALKILLPQLKDLGLNIWLYTGDVYENLIKDSNFRDIIKYIDILVDGPFVEKMLDLNLSYRGSTNQRLIDVKETLTKNQVVIHNI